MPHNRLLLALPLLLIWFSACNKNDPGTAIIDFAVGDRAPNPPLTYTVVETNWKTQLGDGFKIRTPQNRFLLVRVTATNGGGKEAILPLFSVVDNDGKEYREMENGEGIENWFGLLRSIAPAQTQHGQLLFDVPLASYRLRLPNGGPVGEERFVTVKLPLRMDGDQTVQSPDVGSGLTK